MSQEQNIFSPNKKICKLLIKGYLIEKHSLVAEVNFKKTKKFQNI